MKAMHFGCAVALACSVASTAAIADNGKGAAKAARSYDVCVDASTGAAARAGLQEGDIILSVGNVEVANVKAFQAQIAKARFAAYGDSAYPDATFTLRISYGKVMGWTERGKQVPYETTIAGLYDRATG